jgi:hypothetical protein
MIPIIEKSLEAYSKGQTDRMIFPPDWITLFHRERSHFAHSDQVDDLINIDRLCTIIIQNWKEHRFNYNDTRGAKDVDDMYQIISLSMFVRPDTIRRLVLESYDGHMGDLLANVIAIYDETCKFLQVSDNIDISPPLPSSTEEDLNPISVFSMTPIVSELDGSGGNNHVRFADESALSKTQRSYIMLLDMIYEWIQKYPTTGEINPLMIRLMLIHGKYIRYMFDDQETRNKLCGRNGDPAAIDSVSGPILVQFVDYLKEMICDGSPKTPKLRNKLIMICSIFDINVVYLMIPYIYRSKDPVVRDQITRDKAVFQMQENFVRRFTKSVQDTMEIVQFRGTQQESHDVPRRQLRF